ncbi:MAG: GNAT family N-acetyltransferase [Sulfuritalea sp.]|nr:GNAT family N-acetyltransferase [Sulfuritalea sp.]
MTVRNLEFLFHPKSVAVVATLDARARYAEVVQRNLAAGGFPGQVIPVTAKKRSLLGIAGHVHLGKLDAAPDLAVVCAALGDVPQIVAELGARGTRAVIVGPSLRTRMNGEQVQEVRKAILDAARPYMMRILGPGSGGLVVPGSGLNASVAAGTPAPGKIALIAQSAAVAAAAVDRACSRGIGLSSVLHLGASVDVDLPDVLDWLAADPSTEAILVQFDTIAGGRKFMSAARAAARNKPVVAIRGGRGDAPQAGRPFTPDEVYQAALRRAGWVRIDMLEDLFDAAEAMARVRPMHGEQLGILANGRGLGRMAADALLRSGGRLATPSAETLKQLGELLPPGSPLGNPLALPADITPANWAATLEAVLADPATDAVLTVHSPSPFAPGAEVATAICGVARQHMERNVFTCWVGGNAMLEAQQIAAAHGVLSHDSPEKAIAIFLGIVDYERNRDLLAQMPPSQAEDFTADSEAAREAVAEALDAGAATLPARQARRLLQAYGIDGAEYPLAGSIDAAIRGADDIGYPVDLGLVCASYAAQGPLAAGLRSPGDIRIAARDLRDRARAEHPGCRISGYRLRPSAARSGIPALRFGVADDPVFGPVIYLGAAAAAGARQGGVAVALPPLNLALARDLVQRSGVAAEAADGDRAALETAMCKALVHLSQLLTDIDEVAAVELDPVHVEAAGVQVLDARIHVEKRGRRLGFRRFAIRPYPKELEQRVEWRGRQLLIRPIRPEDEATLNDLLCSLEAEDSRMRFFGTMRNLPRSQLARFTQIDYDREMSLVAVERGSDGVEHSLGEVRAMADPDNLVAEFAIVVRSELKGQGLGRLLLENMIDYLRARGTAELRGETMSGNLRMVHLAQDLKFEVKTGADIGTVDLRLPLHEHPPH